MADKTGQKQGKRREKQSKCRVVFVGYQGVGKTSVIARLVKEPGFLQDEAAVREISYSTTCAGRPLELQCVDFGNKIKHILYPCFFTPRTLYVVVCDARQEGYLGAKNEYQEQAEKWLSLLQAHAPDCPVIVLLNKADKAGPDFILSGLERCNSKFASMDKQKKSFRIVTKGYTLTPEQERNPVLKREKEFQDANWNSMEQQILWEAYRLCADNYPSAETDCDHGQFVYSRGRFIRRNLNRMAADMGRLLEREPGSASSRGILTREDAERILKGGRKSAHLDRDVDFLLDIMEERKILFKFGESEEQRWLCPATLQEKPPDNADNDLTRRFRNAYLQARNPPKDVKTLHYTCVITPSRPSNIIVEMFNRHRDIGKLDTERIWKHGALFRQKSGACEALIEAPKDESDKIEIWIAGKRSERHAYLKQLRDALMECLNSFSPQDFSSKEIIKFQWTLPKKRNKNGAPVDCEVGYGDALEKAAKGELIHSPQINRMIRPGDILQTRSWRDGLFSATLGALRAHSDDFDAFNKFCDAVGHILKWLPAIVPISLFLWQLLSRVLSYWPDVARMMSAFPFRR